MAKDQFGNYQAGLQHPPPPKSPQEMNADELAKLGHSELAQQERQHRETQKRLDSLAAGQSELKGAVERVHCVDKWILAVSVVGAIAAVVLIFLKR